MGKKTRMPAELAIKVLENYKYKCGVCGGTYMLQIHHIFGGSYRKISECEETLIPLCWDCHHGDDGVEGKNGEVLANKLKNEAIAKVRAKGWTDIEIINRCGKLWYG